MQTVSFAGSNYNIPNTRGDRPWSGFSDFVIAAASKAINTAGGNFTLLADINFGATFGLVSTYYKSRTANVATAGQVRLAKTDVVSWRNNANGANIDLAKNTSDELLWNGSRIILAGGGLIVNADVSASAAIVYSKLSLTGGILNADINASAAIAVSKLAALTASRNVRSDGSGFLTTGAITLSDTNDVTGTLAATSGGTGQSTVTQGDLLYGASNAWSKLAKNASSTRYLSNTGSSNDPAWAQVALATGVSGTLPIANGGTGQTALSAFVPTIQKFTSGSGTYTTPAGCTWIKVRMVGGGGGGVGSGTVAGVASGNGGNTTFGSALLAANGGSGGAWASGPNAGGTASLGSGPIGIALAGSYGDALNDGTGTSQRPSGGSGGTSPLGGAGAGGQINQAGSAGITNSGSGGGGGGGFSSASEVATGQGGGAGGYVDAIITGPSASYAYAVGAAGTAGGAGTGGSAGGAGGSGLILVEEHYI